VKSEERAGGKTVAFILFAGENKITSEGRVDRSKQPLTHKSSVILPCIITRKAPGKVVKESLVMSNMKHK